MWESWHGRWAAILYEPHPKHATRIAQFDTQEEAAIAYDRVALYRWGHTAARNFPDRALKPASIADIRREARERTKARKTSRWEGVSLRSMETILQKREASIMRSAGDRGAASRLAHGVEAA